jgi:hypothetical protein
MLDDLITLFTLVLPREPPRARYRFRTIKCRKVQECVFWTFYASDFLDLKDPSLEVRRPEITRRRKRLVKHRVDGRYDGFWAAAVS